MDKKPAPAAGQEHRNLSTITSKFALVQQTFLKKKTNISTTFTTYHFGILE
jgi:hypothetical protein